MQITKAMELVASSKLRRAKTRAEDARPFFDELYAIMCRTAGLTKGLDTVYAAKREIKNRLYIVIAGDRGLAGGYNSNILKLADGRWTDDGIKPKIIAIGKKSVEFFSKRGYELIGEYPGLSEYIKVADAADIAQTATDMFLKHEADEIVLFFTQFVSPLVQNPIAMPVLPIIAPVGSLDGERILRVGARSAPHRYGKRDRQRARDDRHPVACLQPRAAGENNQRAKRNSIRRERAVSIMKGTKCLWNAI